MNNLINYLNEINEKRNLQNILYWELDTIIPIDSYDYYADLSSKLATEVLEMSTSDKYIELVNNVINSNEFSKLEEHKQIYIKDLKKNYEKEKKIPKEFFKKYEKQKSISKLKWNEAKEKNDYSIFKPYLEENIEMTKELYRYIDKEKNLYNLMLDDYEKGITIEDIDGIFEELKNKIIPIIKNLKENDLKDIKLDLSEDKLMQISKYLLNYIGFDNNRGALGIYPHGYTATMNKDDIRIAFNKNDNIFDFISTIVHEGGHGIFEQYSGKEFNELYISDINTIALHESQSRFFENILGRNINFYVPIYNDIKDMTGLTISLEEFIKYFNDAKPSYIRTKADELTYCMHIIIRYELEKEIFNGNIDLDKLPEIWNKKYKDYMGIDVKDDRDGILQDVHWSECLFGYFPSYLLGSILDGMLLDTINEKVGNVDTLLKEGRIKEITKFLNENIHKYMGAYNVLEVSKRVCKKELDVNPIVEYFKNKY